MEGIKFSERIIINEKAKEVFDFTQDYNNRLTWDRFLIKAELINGATKAGKGAKAYCVAKNKIGMETEYVTFNRPKVTAIKMTKGPFMFKTFFGSWTFNEFDNSATEVIFLYSFKLRFPFNIFTFFIQQNLKSNVRQRLTDLKNCIED